MDIKLDVTKYELGEILGIDNEHTTKLVDTVAAIFDELAKTDMTAAESLDKTLSIASTLEELIVVTYTYGALLGMVACNEREE